MAIDPLNRWVSLGSNIGVIVGLALLILELNQSNYLAMAQIEQARSDSLVQWRREWVTNDHVVPLIQKLYEILPYSEYQELGVLEREEAIVAILNELDPEDRLRMVFFFYTSYWDFENLYAQYERGLVSVAYWNDRIVRAILIDAPRWKAATGGELPFGRQEFNDEVERLLEAYSGEHL